MLKQIKEFLKFIKIQKKKDIIFYSEGSHDTIYYKDIIKILEEEYNVKILVLTSEKKDIAFQIKSNLTNIIFIGDGFFRTISFMLVKTKIFVMSVPDLDNFYLKKNKSKKTKYIYIFHSVSSTNAAYYKKAFDNYDIIFCRGPHQKNEILENESSRKIIGFDDFGKFTSKGNKEDKIFAKKFIKEIGFGIKKKELENIFKENNYSNFELIEGDVVKTLPIFLKKNKHLKISLLHLDLDIFRPTFFVLEKLFNKVVKGGIILFDDYAEISGATEAVDKFFKNKNYKIEKLKYYKRPSFVVKK